MLILSLIHIFLELNYRCRTGEIDIIARDGGYLVFVEVKYRKTKRAGYALEAIDSRKAGQVRRVAAVYLYAVSYTHLDVYKRQAV